MSSIRQIERTIEIAAPIAKVWKAITEAEELQRWFPIDAEGEAGVGGRLSLKWGDRFEWRFRVEISVKEKHLRLVYKHQGDFTANIGDAVHSPASSDKELAVDYFLEAKAGKTVLRLVHSGFGEGEDWDQEYDGASRGWTIELRSLKHYLENHDGKDRSVAWAHVMLKQSVAFAWKKLMSPQALLQEGSIEGLSEGDAYEIKTVLGDTFKGKVSIFTPPIDFIATAENLNDAVLQVHLEKYGEFADVWIWLSTYGLPDSQVQDLENRYQQLLNDLFLATDD